MLLFRHWVIKQAEIGESSAVCKACEVAQFLDGIVGEDEGRQVGDMFVQIRLDAVNAIVGEE